MIDRHTIFVYIGAMIKNITFTADETTIQLARQRAAVENTTLNELVRRWLAQYITNTASANHFDEIMEQLAYARAGRKFSRDEMNERS